MKYSCKITLFVGTLCCLLFIDSKVHAQAGDLSSPINVMALIDKSKYFNLSANQCISDATGIYWMNETGYSDAQYMIWGAWNIKYAVPYSVGRGPNANSLEFIEYLIGTTIYPVTLDAVNRGLIKNNIPMRTNKYYTAGWVFTMGAPGKITTPTVSETTICGNSSFTIASSGNMYLLSDSYVKSSVVWEYNVNGATTWIPFDSGSVYNRYITPSEIIPEIKSSKKVIRFRCRTKAEYSTLLLYSPYSTASEPIEILPAPPKVDVNQIVYTNTCFGEQTGRVSIPAAAIISGFTEMRWILREGTVTEPCFPNLDGSSSNCGTGIKQSNGNVLVSGGISMSGLAAGDYSLWIINPGEEKGSCFRSYSLKIKSFDPLTVTENIAQRADISCYNARNGTLGVTAAGGNPDGKYSFTLLDGNNVEVRAKQEAPGTMMLWEGLPAGTYKVEVENGSCTSPVRSSWSVTLTQPPAITGEIVVTQPTCSAPGNGSIAVAANTIVSKYRYNLYQGGILIQQSGSVMTSDYTFSNLSTGDYAVEIINDEAAGCEGWLIATTLNAVTPLVLTLTSRDSVSCHGGSNGTLGFSASGGSGLYAYTLSGAGITTTTNTTGAFSGLPAGPYTIVLKNQISCNDEVSQSIAIYERALLSVSLQSTGLTCYGANDGILKSDVNGGSGSYRYGWEQLKNGVWTGSSLWLPTDTQIEGLAPGTYRLTITDTKAIGCTVISDPIVIEDVLAIGIANVAITDAICLAEGATIKMTGTGGTGSYTYAWSLDNGNTYTPFTATTPFTVNGQYKLRLSDSNGCSEETVTLYEIAVPTAALSFTANLSSYHGFNISCEGAVDGRIEITATGGNGGSYSGYTYKLDDGIYQSSNVFDGLPAGDYDISVKDGRGCEVTQHITLVQPSIHINAIKTDILCHGSSTGSITTHLSGGAAPYVLSVNGSVVRDDIALSNLGAGIYELRVTDANGCLKDSTIEIIYSYPALEIENAVVHDIACFGGAGNISIGVSGGDGIYQYALSEDNWSTSHAYTNQSDVGAGIYKLRVTDGQGCMITYRDNLVITAPSIPLSFTATLSDYNGFNISCSGGDNGFAEISAIGGNGASYSGYTYALDGGAYGAASLVTHINAGAHVLHVKDDRGCVASQSYSFTQSAEAIDIVLVRKEDVKCAFTPEGSITVSGSGGVGALQYSLDNNRWQSGAVFSGLAADNYTIYVKDANSCGSSLNVSIVPTNPAIVLDNVVVKDIICYGEQGRIEITAHGGTGTLVNEYALNGGNYDKVFTNTTGLSAGTYRVRVVDGAGCYSPVSEDLHITAPSSALSAVITTSNYHGVQISCYGLADGMLSIAASGGNGGDYSDYEYSVNHSGYGTISRYTNLSAGQYEVSLQDDRGCVVTQQVVLKQPSSTLSLSVSSIEHLSCGGTPTGMIALQSGGGTSPYTYTLDNNNWQDGSIFGGLTAGDYVLQVEDANGCVATSTATIITKYSAITASAEISPVSCYGQSDGKLAVTVSGGDGHYTYDWNTAGLSGHTLQAIKAGDYVVTVTDGAGCSQSFNYTVSQPAGLLMEVTAPAICDGLSDGRIDATVTGGILPYQYSLDNSSWLSAGTFSEMSAGNYELKVQDANGCEVNKSFAIGKINVQPDVNFLVASRKNALDTLAIKEISLPAPDNVRWSYHPDAILLGYDGGTPLIKFATAGTYWVEMTATFGSCTYSQRKELTISAYDPLAGPGYSMPVHVIDTVLLAPNPNDGYFHFKIKLNRKQQVIAYVYDINGVIAGKKQYAPTLEIDDQFSVGATTTGTFILRVITESESKDVRFIISK